MDHMNTVIYLTALGGTYLTDRESVCFIVLEDRPPVLILLVVVG
jgi:hypothetical protein